jgi:hypothetical protein
MKGYFSSQNCFRKISSISISTMPIEKEAKMEKVNKLKRRKR